MDLDPPQTSDNMSSAPEPELDIDISQLEDIDARRRETASKGVFARSVLALRSNVPTSSLPEDTAEPPLIPVSSITCTSPAPIENQLFVDQPGSTDAAYRRSFRNPLGRHVAASYTLTQ